MKTTGEPSHWAAVLANRRKRSCIGPPRHSGAVVQPGNRRTSDFTALDRPRNLRLPEPPDTVKETKEGRSPMRHGVRRLAIALATLMFVAPAWAGPPTDQVRQYTDQVQKILDDPAMRSADKRAAVRKVAGEVFDVNETARRALGRHWQGRSATERDEFVHLFADLLERTYISKIDLYGGERLRYTSEAIDGNFAIVRAKIITTKSTEVPVE